MLKSFRQLVLRCLTFSLLAIALIFSNLAFSNPLFAQAESSAEGPKPPSTELKSTVKDRANIAPEEKSSVTEPEKDISREPATKVTSPESQDEYDMTVIHKFDRELYGD